MLGSTRGSNLTRCARWPILRTGIGELRLLVVPRPAARLFPFTLQKGVVPCANVFTDLHRQSAPRDAVADHRCDAHTRPLIHTHVSTYDFGAHLPKDYKCRQVDREVRRTDQECVSIYHLVIYETYTVHLLPEPPHHRNELWVRVETRKRFSIPV